MRCLVGWVQLIRWSSHALYPWVVSFFWMPNICGICISTVLYTIVSCTILTKREGKVLLFGGSGRGKAIVGRFNYTGSFIWDIFGPFWDIFVFFFCRIFCYNFVVQYAVWSSHNLSGNRQWNLRPRPLGKSLHRGKYGSSAKEHFWQLQILQMSQHSSMGQKGKDISEM
jgi:hypothetical protein